MLAELSQRLENANKELSTCPEGTLSYVKRHGRGTFFQIIYYGGKRLRKSINKAPDFIRGLARKEYLIKEKKHTTSRGLKVRSKSEVLIAEMLYIFNIQFRYEQVIRINGIVLVPDFTIRLPNGKIFYWEHCGLMSSREYREHQKWKMEMYEKAGIVPWKNLIVTYDDEDGNINVGIIESEIKNKLIV